jgi:tetratricopeptide (TPR) repeat protein
MPRLPRSEPLLLAALLVVAATLAAYAGTLSADFVFWDDNLTIYANPNLGALSLERIAWAFTDVATTMRWMPLTLLSLSLTYTLHGLDPFGYHLANWLIHGASALLLFLLLRELLGAAARRRGGDAGGHWVLVSAAAGALAWSLHPLRAEVVAWANSRGHAQAALFLLLSLLLYARARREDASPPRRWAGNGAALAAYLAALMSHPIATSAVALFPLLDVCIGRLGGPSGWWNPAARRVLWEKLPFAAAAVLVLAASFLIRTFSPGLWPPPVPLDQFGVFARAMQATWIVIHYVLVTFWPVGLQPAPTALIDFDPWSAPFLLRAALVAGVSVALFLLRGRWPLALLAWVAHIALLFPVLGLVDHPMFACDRYANLPNLLPAACVGAALLGLGTSPRRRAAGALAASALLVMLGGLAHAQTRTWKNSVTLFEHMLPLLGDHPFRLQILGKLAYVQSEAGNAAAAGGTLKRLASIELEAGSAAAAADALQQAVRLAPTVPQLRSDLAYVLSLSGRAGEALAHLEVAVQLDPRSVDLRCKLGAALLDMGRPAEAARQAAAALDIAPEAACARQILSWAREAGAGR